MEPLACHDLLADVGHRAQLLRRRMAGLTTDLGAEQLLWSPHRGWSIAQILEHLLIFDRLYQERLRRRLTQGAEQPPRDDGAPWRPSMPGRMLLGAMRPARRALPAPTLFAPSLRPRPSVVASYLAGLEELDALLELAAGHDLRRLRFGSPVSSLLRLNAGDALLLLVAHGERHAGQIERVRAEAGFPVRTG
jgi:hypothetical protein